MKCTAHRSNGEPCNNWSIKGAEVCRNHGGSAPRVREAAARRVAEEKAAQEVAAAADAVLAHRAERALENPLDGLARLATEVTAFKDALAARVNSLTAIRYEDMKSAEQLRSEVALYERALDRTARLLETMVKLDFEKRMLALNEAQADLIAKAITGMLDEFELSPSQREKVPDVVPRHLRLLTGNAS